MDRSLTVIRNTEPAEREIDDTELRALLIGQQSQSDEFLVRVLRQHMWVDVAPDPIMVYALNFGDVYDVIIIHRSLDGSDGSAATCQELRRAGMNVPIIVLGPHGTTDDLVEAFDAGADDFMFEPINAELLSARIRA
ncbi:MAG TPA: response regulator, partial [Chloroflexota bacterium]